MLSAERRHRPTRRVIRPLSDRQTDTRINTTVLIRAHHSISDHKCHPQNPPKCHQCPDTEPSPKSKDITHRAAGDRPPQPWPDLHGDRREARCGTKHSRQVHPAGQAPASRRTHITFVGHVFLNQRQHARRNSAAKPPQSIADTIELGTNEYTKRPTTNSSKGTLNTHATTELESPRGSNSVGMAASVCIKSPTMAPPNTGPV